MIDTRQEPTFGISTGQPRPRRRQRSPGWGFVAILLCIVAAAAAWFWTTQVDAPLPVRASVPLAHPDDGAPPAPAPAAIVHPPPTDAAPRPATGNEVADALREAFGDAGVNRFLQATDFPRRLVATIDNLGRDHAPVAAWPVLPTPGRFTASPENAERYRPFVDFAASLDAARVVDVYRRLYPVLQQAYRDLGFGDRSLHERVIEVTDLLLATPEPAQEPAVAMTQVKGPVQPAQPWTQYAFTDPGLQSLSAGQKILLRMGADNRHRLKAKLREIRTLLVRPAAGTR